MILALASLVDNNVPVAKQRAIQLRNRFLRLLVVTHLDEAETSAAARFSIHDDSRRNNFSKLPEEISEILIGRLIWQAAYVNSHSNLLPLDVY